MSLIDSVTIGGGTGGGAGSVTSVGLTASPILIINGSPVTGAGFMGITFAAEASNFVFAGPASGATGTPLFRALVNADLAGVTYVSSVGFTASPEFIVSGSPVGSSGILGITFAPQRANFGLMGPASGATATPTFRAFVQADMPFFGVTNITSDASLSIGFIHLINTGATRSLSLPTHSTGQIVYIKDATGTCASMSIVVNRTGGGNLDGLAASRSLFTNWGSWRFLDDGTNWFIID